MKSRIETKTTKTIIVEMSEEESRDIISFINWSLVRAHGPYEEAVDSIKKFRDILTIKETPPAHFCQQVLCGYLSPDFMTDGLRCLELLNHEGEHINGAWKWKNRD